MVAFFFAGFGRPRPWVLALAMGVDLLFPLGGEEAGGVEFAGQVEVAGSDFVFLRLVYTQWHDLQVCDYVVQPRADGAGDDAVNGKMVADGGGLGGGKLK
jgi:hypothetical protein